MIKVKYYYLNTKGERVNAVVLDSEPNRFDHVHIENENGFSFMIERRHLKMEVAI